MSNKLILDTTKMETIDFFHTFKSDEGGYAFDKNLIHTVVIDSSVNNKNCINERYLHHISMFRIDLKHLNLYQSIININKECENYRSNNVYYKNAHSIYFNRVIFNGEIKNNRLIFKSDFNNFILKELTSWSKSNPNSRPPIPSVIKLVKPLNYTFNKLRIEITK